MIPPSPDDPAAPAAPQPTLAELTAALIEQYGGDAVLLIDYAQNRRGDGETEWQALAAMVAAAQEGRREEMIELASTPFELLQIKRRAAAALQERIAKLTGLKWDDPMTIREIRRTVRHYFNEVTRTARPLQIAQLVETHVRYDLVQGLPRPGEPRQKPMLRINVQGIIRELWDAKAF